VPTLKELGVDIDYAVWAGAFMHKNVPAPIRKTLENAMGKIAADPSFKEAVAKTSSTLAYLKAAEFQAWWEKDTAATDAVIKKVVASSPPQ
jgi:tripartite-type tricarboxylate transporter receptor subunit TctC